MHLFLRAQAFGEEAGFEKKTKGTQAAVTEIWFGKPLVSPLFIEFINYERLNM